MSSVAILTDYWAWGGGLRELPHAGVAGTPDLQPVRSTGGPNFPTGFWSESSYETEPFNYGVYISSRCTVRIELELMAIKIVSSAREITGKHHVSSARRKDKILSQVLFYY